ncbi:MAG: UDP-N-acetylmuramoyl-L-alanine--D-glutamate ligase, partial [Myxococcales bacterium]|nr:UDP-N-acetylmuramoyl-L-alanine--D-glutamate ligase [Myxococcales bacterium]
MIELRDKRILVVGLGASGLAAARLLKKRGARVVLNDLRTADALGEATVTEAKEVSSELVLGEHPASLFTSVDHIVLSPGVPPLPALDAADGAGVPVSSEIELASWFLRSTVIAITGTNGKSTVTSLVGEMCTQSGRPTFVGGNLGTPLVDVVDTAAADEGGFVVVEVSSFQLERLQTFHAKVAVLLNVTPDHLDRYASFKDYAAAKGHIFERQTPDDTAVVPAGDEACTTLAKAGAGTVRTFGAGGDVAVHGDVLASRDGAFRFPLGDLRIAGAHNVDNACASVLAARAAGVPDDAIVAALRAFSGLPHRMVLVGEAKGVRFYDDSKATNVGASVAALAGFDGARGKVVLIAGGKDKGGSYAPLRDAAERVARLVVLIGEATPLLEEAFAGSAVSTRRAFDL